MKFIRFENRLINLEAIGAVQFLPPASLTIDYLDGGTAQFSGDEADRLWELLLQHSSGAIAKVDLLASIDNAQMLDCLGMHLAAVELAAEALITAGATIAGRSCLDVPRVQMQLLAEGKRRYEQQSPTDCEQMVDRNLTAWESVANG
ncbi:MAG: hypothetical protein HC895_11595 [Leptolyngbyaceae cyanobacterium SM1_3_5]|nr:hypothetical protein [Leptolyngbyaceae cyanobacterium SM1_3_5]